MVTTQIVKAHVGALLMILVAAVVVEHALTHIVMLCAPITVTPAVMVVPIIAVDAGDLAIRALVLALVHVQYAQADVKHIVMLDAQA